MHQNGKIYATPFYADQYIELDPETETTALVGTPLVGNQKFIGTIAHPNGKIYSSAFVSTQSAEFDPVTGVAQLIGRTFPTGKKWLGNVLYSNSRIYSPPNNHNQILMINPSGLSPMSERFLSAFQNKF